MGGKKEIYRDVGLFHGAIQLYMCELNLTALHNICTCVRNVAVCTAGVTLRQYIPIFGAV